MRKREAGAGGALIAVVLAFIALLIVAFVSLNRTTSGSAEREQTGTKLVIAATALESYAGAAQRLPCPADPTVDVGDEVTLTATTCKYGEGTLPWKTIGMRRDDSFDAWGRKISYRVYSGDAGSLTQPGGASMANCDTLEAFPGGVTATGLCRPDPSTATAAELADPATRTTTPAQFLVGAPAPPATKKGLWLTDSGAPQRKDVAYVLISHGVTGLGGYTASGTRLDMPSNVDEKNNTKDTGPFTIRAFSDTDTGATDVAHFDDILVYRGIEDVAKRANLGARNWPDTILSAVVFDRATVKAALGGTNPGSDTGQSTIAFNNATVSAFNSGGSQNISFVSGGGSTDGLGGVSGGDDLLGSAGAERLQIDFAEDARKFAFTLDNFEDSGSLHERVELRFFEVVGTSPPTLKGAMIKESCANNGKATSFSLDAGTSFNRVEVRPTPKSDASDSSFSLSEIRTCVASVACETSLKSSGNLCNSKTFAAGSIGSNDASVLTITLANNNSSPDITGVDLTDTYPTGLVNTASAATTTCGGTVTAANGGASLALAGGTVAARSGSGPGTCTVTVNVTSASAASYVNSTGGITTTNVGTLAALSGALSVLAHPEVAKAFSPATVSQNASSILTYTLSNSNAASTFNPPANFNPTSIFNASFTDTFPTGLTAVSGATTDCVGGTVTISSNGTGVVLSGATIPAVIPPAIGTCIVTVNVTSAATGTYVSTLPAGALKSDNAGTSTGSASATLIVN